MINKTLNFNKTNLANLPQMNNPVESWSIPLQLIKITQNIIDGDKAETETKINFKGVIQPLMAEDLQFKPEGLRSFEWLQIHCVSSNLNLHTNDKIKFNDKRFKVMDIKDYSLYSYIEYHCIRDYE